MSQPVTVPSRSPRIAALGVLVVLALAATLLAAAPTTGAAVGAAPAAESRAVSTVTPKSFSNQLRLAVNHGNRPAALRLATTTEVNQLFARKRLHWTLGAVGTCRLRGNRTSHECPVPTTRTTNSARATLIFIVRGRSAPFKVVDFRVASARSARFAPVETPQTFSNRLRLAVNHRDDVAVRRMTTTSARQRLVALRTSRWVFGAVGRCRARTFVSGYECSVPITRKDTAPRTVIFVVAGRAAPFKVVQVRYPSA